MNRNCRQCTQQYKITAEDLAFYDKVSPLIGGKKYPIPPPTLCPDCRQRRRLAWRNERKLYHRKCDYSGEAIISLYSPDKPYKVYKEEIWHSDKWDPLACGREFGAGNKFFPEFRELQLAVPRRAMQQDGTNENCKYVTFGQNNKNCYLAFVCFNSDNLYYSVDCGFLKDSSDCLFSDGQELLYECVDCKSCTNCVFCRNCRQCSDSILLEDCRNCSHCIACKNLRNKSYHINNKPVTKEEFEKYREELRGKNLTEERKKFMDWQIRLPSPHIRAVNAVDSDGDYLENVHNCHNCFDVLRGAEDCSYCCFSGWDCKDMMDCNNTGPKSELIYESLAIAWSQRITHSFFIRNSYDLFYCDNMIECHDCFGCIGLTRKQYCILNKQYAKVEYEKKVGEIIKSMQEDGEWGEFFPITYSPFAYNETVVMDYFPLDREKCGKEGFQWKEESEKGQFKGQPAKMPDNIGDADDGIIGRIFSCENCGANYRLIIQELRLYRKMGIAPPHHCFDCRHGERMRSRNPRKLWNRACAKCKAAIRTTYSPDRPEIVYCEKCYLKEVY
jgi:hypothetical protein